MQTMRRLGAYWNKPRRAAYLFITPAGGLLILFCVLPLLASFLISTLDMGVNFGAAKFVGIDNYVKAFADRKFIQSILVNFRFTLVEVPLQMIIGLALSAVLTKNTFVNKMFRSIYFFPVVISAVAVGITWQLVLHSNVGLFTYWLERLQVTDINLLNTKGTALGVVVFVSIWKTFGISTIILVAAMQNVPGDLYEAADLDGAGKIRQFFAVTLPDIMPAFWFLLMTRVIGSLQVFDIIYTLTGGGPARSTTTTVVYIYEVAFNKLNKMGYATAMSEILFVIIMLITVVEYFIMSKTSD